MNEPKDPWANELWVNFRTKGLTRAHNLGRIAEIERQRERKERQESWNNPLNDK